MVYQLILTRAAEAEAQRAQQTGHDAPVAPQPLAETHIWPADKAGERPQPIGSSM